MALKNIFKKIIRRDPWSLQKKLADGILKNDPNAVQKAIALGADINGGLDHNFTALGMAAIFGRTDVIKTLIKAGADLNQGSKLYDHTPLMQAACNNHVQIIKLLLDAGADKDIKSSDGQTAGMVAYDYGHHETAELLGFVPDPVEKPSPRAQREAWWAEVKKAKFKK